MVDVGDKIKAYEIISSDDGEIRRTQAGIYTVIEIEKDLSGLKYWVDSDQPTFFYDFETEPLDEDNQV